jgi:hypothetical protein
MTTTDLLKELNETNFILIVEGDELTCFSNLSLDRTIACLTVTNEKLTRIANETTTDNPNDGLN